MTDVSTLARQFTLLEVSKKSTSADTSKLLTKSAAPNPPNPTIKPIASNSSLRVKTNVPLVQPPKDPKHSKQAASIDVPETDIGKYDGGLEGEDAVHSRKNTMKRIATLDYKFPASFDADAKDLISKLLKLEPEERLPLTEVMVHPWILRNRG
ncbi:hypothetical protein D9757_006331 [Collybiopsis confluens]|uniref:Aurora kinase n=1 Tax=Collybiopsis confluens TaxID=2823264 RepID=A0A8H5M6Y0_9AGAR|nr:hypothetical protein D9757_006331 [Collybiopsis confluens]